MDDSEIIGGFEALFGAMSAEQQTRINAYLAARVGPAKPAPVAEPKPSPTTMPSALAVVHYIDHMDVCPVAVVEAFKRAAKRGVTVGEGRSGDPLTADIVARCVRELTTPEALAVVAKALDAAMAKAGIQPLKTLPSAADVAAWLNAQGGELPDAVMNAISAATTRHIKEKFPPAAVPSSPPYDFLRNIPPPQTDWEEKRRLLDDTFRDHTEPYGFGKQWVGTTTSPNALAQQPPDTQTIGDSKQWVVTGVRNHGPLTEADVDGVQVDYSQIIGAILKASAK